MSCAICRRVPSDRAICHPASGPVTRILPGALRPVEPLPPARSLAAQWDVGRACACVRVSVRLLAEGEQVAVGVFEPAHARPARRRPDAARVLLEVRIAPRLYAVCHEAI